MLSLSKDRYKHAVCIHYIIKAWSVNYVQVVPSLDDDVTRGSPPLDQLEHVCGASVKHTRKRVNILCVATVLGHFVKPTFKPCKIG